MSSQVDLSGLSIDRGSGGRPTLRTRRHVLTRYVLPLVLLAGFLSLVAWASWDYVFPARPVTVLPVLSTTAAVRQEGTPLFQAAGWIEPRPTPVRVAALAPGVVDKLLVVEDQPVKAGETVAVLVTDDARLVRDRMQADLDLREAEREEASSSLKAAQTRFEQPVHLEAALGEAEALLAKTETELKNLPFAVRRAEADELAARSDYEGKLAAKGVVKGIDIDIAHSTLASATALVEELRDRLASLERERTALVQRRDALQTQLELLADEIKAKEESEAKVKGAAARVAQARVALAEAELQFDRMTIRSPIDGRVFRLIADPGTRLAGGMGPDGGYDGSTVVTLYRPDMLQVRVDVRFQDLPKVSLHQPVAIDNPALSSPLEGEVLFISSEADIQKNTLQVKVAIHDAPPVFKPEMLVDVTFLAPKPPDEDTEPSQELKLYVLQQLVHQDESGSFVWVADQSAGVARKTPVQTGAIGSNGLVEITGGLNVASRVISSGTDGLRDGTRIRVESEDPSLGGDAGLNGAGGAGNDREGSGGKRPLNRLPTGEHQ
jgi:RND family efflux transporter MFP subunit